VLFNQIPLIFLRLGEILKTKEESSTHVDLQQRRAYECGFSAFQSARRPFSVYFFLVGILFVVFDVELILLIPLPYFSWLNTTMGCGLGLFFFILVLGLYHEWREGRLNWPGAGRWPRTRRLVVTLLRKVRGAFSP